MQFRPDSPHVSDVVPSPNHGPRRGGVHPDLLLLHYTGMKVAAEALERLCSPAAQVSAHYFVFEDGRIVQSVPEAERAWHAGQSCWAGSDDINSCSIGIEIANPGHDHGYPDFPPAQIAAVIALCRDIVSRHAIRPTRVLAHSDVAPLRKQDPGEKFPWRALFEAGVGHWVEPAPLGPPAAIPHSGPVGSSLRRYGYCVQGVGTGDVEKTSLVEAFQRHFRPARVDGIVDQSTRETLQLLLAGVENECAAKATQG
jgi:N-acetylmuramoyl-L-alanine amidase